MIIYSKIKISRPQINNGHMYSEERKKETFWNRATIILMLVGNLKTTALQRSKTDTATRAAVRKVSTFAVPRSTKSGKY